MFQSYFSRINILDSLTEFSVANRLILDLLMKERDSKGKGIGRRGYLFLLKFEF